MDFRKVANNHARTETKRKIGELVEAYREGSEYTTYFSKEIIESDEFLAKSVERYIDKMALTTERSSFDHSARALYFSGRIMIEAEIEEIKDGYNVRIKQRDNDDELLDEMYSKDSTLNTVREFLSLD